VQAHSLWSISVIAWLRQLPSGLSRDAKENRPEIGRFCCLSRMACLLSQWWLLSQEIWPSGARGGFRRGCGLLAADDLVHRTLVKHGVSGIGADDKVVARCWIEINLGKAHSAVDCEADDMVTRDCTQGAAPQADSIVAVCSGDGVIPNCSVLCVVGTHAFRQNVLYSNGVVPDRRLNPGVSNVIEEVHAVGILSSPNKLVVINEVPGWAAGYKWHPRRNNPHACASTR